MSTLQVPSGGGGGGGGAVATGGGAAPAAAAEEKKEEKEEEKVRFSDVLRTPTCSPGRAGGVRRRHGLRSLRLICYIIFSTLHVCQSINAQHFAVHPHKGPLLH